MLKGIVGSNPVFVIFLHFSLKSIKYIQIDYQFVENILFNLMPLSQRANYSICWLCNLSHHYLFCLVFQNMCEICHQFIMIVYTHAYLHIYELESKQTCRSLKTSIIFIHANYTRTYLNLFNVSCGFESLHDFVVALITRLFLLY